MICIIIVQVINSDTQQTCCQYTLCTVHHYSFMYIFGMKVIITSFLLEAYHSALNTQLCSCLLLIIYELYRYKLKF